ncbi:MAG: hypothetical protein QM786_00955 [Breznakibacter sp.]
MRFICLENEDIDRDRWDYLIDTSSIPQVYAKSWMLDAFSPGWSALVGNDWNWIMPLPVSKKWRIPYLVQPIFFQQLGIFSQNPVAENTIHEVMSYLSKHFPFVRYQFNRSNQLEKLSDRITTRQTFELDLTKGYEDIKRGFSQSHRKNINKCFNRGVVVYSSSDLTEHLNLMQAMYKKMNVSAVKDRHYQMFRKIADYGIRNTGSRLYYAINGRGAIIGSAFFLRSGKQFIIFTVRSVEGIENRCTFVLVDNFLREECGSGNYLDFAGSDIPGIAEFNAGWGAINYVYLRYSNQWLPFNM